MKEENGSDEAFTVRLYGPNTDYVIDRKRELLVGLDPSCPFDFIVNFEEIGLFLSFKYVHIRTNAEALVEFSSSAI